MEDDITFGTSVWGTSDDIALPSSSRLTLSFPPINLTGQDKDHEDFENFDATDPTPSKDHEDDDFGDFGDFGDAQGAEVQADFVESMELSGGGWDSGPFNTEWQPLRLVPMPTRSDLEDETNGILEPLWNDQDILKVTTTEGIREVEGVSQILVTPESRDLYNKMFQPLPPTKPPNWTRSRIRRQHLIALGIPVNLDEVLPRTNGKPLPTLQITTRPMSAPPGPHKATHPSDLRGETPRAGTPQSNGRATNSTSQASLGPRPDLDERKMSEILGLQPDSLSLIPLSKLERILADLRAQTAQTSSLLTYLLQTREALQQDSETYNGLIAELVSEAQKPKTGKGRTTSKRGSGMN